MKNKLEKFKLWKIWQPQDIITYFNLLFGIACIYFSIENNLKLAAVMVLLAVLMDYLDGKVASALNKKTEFGKQIDSLADLVSFGVAPSIFGFCYFRMEFNNTSILLLLSIAFYIICGLSRLARYNMIHDSSGFIGMPITVNGVLFPLYYYITISAAYLPIIYLISGSLMISHMKVKRLP